MLRRQHVKGQQGCIVTAACATECYSYHCCVKILISLCCVVLCCVVLCCVVLCCVVLCCVVLCCVVLCCVVLNSELFMPHERPTWD